MKHYRRIPTQDFRRDLRRLSKAGYALDKLNHVITQLAEGKHLDGSYKEHELRGNLAGIRECHIEPDWLLLYKYKHTKLILLLLRTGTHARIFKKKRGNANS